MTIVGRCGAEGLVGCAAGGDALRWLLSFMADMTHREMTRWDIDQVRLQGVMVAVAASRW